MYLFTCSIYWSCESAPVVKDFRSYTPSSASLKGATTVIRLLSAITILKAVYQMEQHDWFLTLFANRVGHSFLYTVAQHHSRPYSWQNVMEE